MDELPRGHYGAILADPPWRFQPWSEKGKGRAPEQHYPTLDMVGLARLPVDVLAADDCVLFLWVTWPLLNDAMFVIGTWGFTYKTAAFVWTKAHAGQMEMFQDDIEPYMGLGYWTRANTEPCLLATRGKPKRLDAGVRQAIIEPRRQHSRKPDCIHERIERLVAGPYLELFARQRRPGWAAWGNEVDKFTPPMMPQACIYPHCLSPDTGGNEPVCLRQCPTKDAKSAYGTWEEMWAKPFDFSQEPKNG